jgi:hypothetical protein
MRLPFLKHLIESVATLARPERIVVIGSSSLLPAHGELGEAGQPLEISLDADLLITPVNQVTADMLIEAVGRESAFMRQYGYYADILRPAITEALPQGWESRLHPVAGFDNAFMLDPYDLALVKLMVGRKKDLDLLRALLTKHILDPAALRRHYQAIPLGEREMVAAGCNLTLLLQELGME